MKKYFKVFKNVAVAVLSRRDSFGCGRDRFDCFRALEWTWQKIFKHFKKFCKSIEI